jgi:hypothetical protein
MSTAQFERMEAALDGLEKAKNWFRNSAVAFAVSAVIMIGSVALNNYRLNKVEDNQSLFATKKGVELLKQAQNAEIDAFINLADTSKKCALQIFHDKINIINDNIFMFGMDVSRGGKEVLKQQ